MPSSVFYADMRTNPKEGMVKKFARLIDTAGLAKVLRPGDLTAIKLHFGELGNTAYVRPIFIRPVADAVRAAKAVPFITDANTLYVGTRANSPSHLETALKNGFDFTTVGAPLIIADGLRGGMGRRVELTGATLDHAWVGAEIADAAALISVAHFKGHEMSGFGGTIKNVGMGSASRRGKLAQHSNVSPRVSAKQCIGCGDCVDHCAQQAIALEDNVSAIDPQKCVGCGECILACPQGAIQVQWDTAIPEFMRRMVEYTKAVLTGKENSSFFINFVTQVSPACDCYPHSDAAIVADVGILASADPVALDQASVDLVNRQPGNPLSCLGDKAGAGTDKFRLVYPKIDWTIQLDYAEKLGLGSRQYEIVTI